MRYEFVMKAWYGFIASATGATTALSTMDWRNLFQFCLNVVGTIVAITAGVYSIRSSRRALKRGGKEV